MATLTVKYYVSDEVRRQELLASGKAGPAERALVIDLGELTEERRRQLLELATTSDVRMEHWTMDVRKRLQLLAEPRRGAGDSASHWIDDGSIIINNRDRIIVKQDKPLATVADVVELALPIARNNREIEEQARKLAKKRREALAEERRRNLELYEQVHNQLYGPDGLITNEDLEGLLAFRWPEGYPSNNFQPTSSEEQEMTLHGNVRGALRSRYDSVVESAIKSLRKARREAQKDAWIREHGSEHLQRAWAAGYNSQRQYVLERASVEAPGWTVDFNGTAEWDSRSFPSAEALDLEEQARALAEAIGGRLVGVVWLTAPPSADVPTDDDDYEYEQYFSDRYEAREAVVIAEYLQSYHLVQEVE